MDDLPLTIPGLFAWSVARRGAQPALHIARDGAFVCLTWAEVQRDVLRLAALLRAWGVGHGDRVAQFAENRYEWILGDLAILQLGAVHVPIHASLSGAQAAQQIRHSEARLVLLAGQTQADVLTPFFTDAKDRPQFAVWDAWPQAEAHPLSPQLLPAKLREMGDTALRNTASDAAPDDLATIMYTSGTLGEPKGVMLSHRNLAGNAVATANRYGDSPEELRLGFLPLSHIYARTCDLYTWLYRGSQFALAQSRETIVDDCQRLHPTLINGVPYFYEKLHRRLREAGKLDQPGVVAQLLGGRVRACFSGGAAAPPHVLDFFAAQGLPIYEGYGLSESSPVISVSQSSSFKRGAVGRPIDGVEIRIAEDGEILTRGPHVMLGYWKDDAATRAVIQDGWLHTGDLGRFDEEGFLHITGRKKEILVTAAGKNIAPAAIEQRLLESPLILQAIVVGEGRNFLAALIVPDPDRLRAEIRARRLWVFSRRGALRHRRVLALYRGEIDRLLAGLSKHEQIGRFVLLDRGFTIESGELTPKASLKRAEISRNFGRIIDALYQS